MPIPQYMQQQYPGFSGGQTRPGASYATGGQSTSYTPPTQPVMDYTPANYQASSPNGEGPQPPDNSLPAYMTNGTAPPAQPPGTIWSGGVPQQQPSASPIIPTTTQPAPLVFPPPAMTAPPQSAPSGPQIGDVIGGPGGSLTWNGADWVHMTGQYSPQAQAQLQTPPASPAGSFFGGLQNTISNMATGVANSMTNSPAPTTVTQAYTGPQSRVASQAPRSLSPRLRNSGPIHLQRRASL